MKRIMSMSLIIVLLYSACLSTAVMAQDVNMPLFSPQTIIKNQVVTGGNQDSVSVYAGHAPVGYVHKLPPGRSGKTDADTGSFSTLTVTAGETLPYSSGFSPDYAATYIGACGVSSRTPAILASSVYARMGSKSLANLQTGEILVMHQWGRYANGFQPENDIVIGRNWSNANYVDFTIYISAYGNPWMKTISCPVSHDYAIYIRAVNPRGTGYSRLEFSVRDLTAQKSYTYQYALPAAQTMDGADMALEKYYGDSELRPGAVLQWRTITSFRVYDQYQRCVNLLQSGYVCEWQTTGVQTAYYHDYRYYGSVRNGDGTFCMTRYKTGSAYPPHP